FSFRLRRIRQTRGFRWVTPACNVSVAIRFQFRPPRPQDCTNTPGPREANTGYRTNPVRTRQSVEELSSQRSIGPGILPLTGRKSPAITMDAGTVKARTRH